MWGRRTIVAVKDFQEAHGLDPDGIVGRLTLRALLGTNGNGAGSVLDSVESGPLVWLEEARRLVGLREVPGPRSNQDLLDMAALLKIPYGDDEIPWCGLFVAHCIGATLPDELLPNLPLRARAWEKFGEPCQPKRGAVLVFWRDSRDGGKGHVGFYHSEDETHYNVLGGNQENKVSIAGLPKNRFLVARWPRSAGSLGGDVVMVAEGKEPVSMGEG